jgi:hypothetical protein
MPQVPTLLQPQPERGSHTRHPRQAQGRVGRHAAATVDDAVQTRERHAQPPRELRSPRPTPPHPAARGFGPRLRWRSPSGPYAHDAGTRALPPADRWIGVADHERGGPSDFAPGARACCSSCLRSPASSRPRFACVPTAVGWRRRTERAPVAASTGSSTTASRSMDRVGRCAWDGSSPGRATCSRAVPRLPVGSDARGGAFVAQRGRRPRRHELPTQRPRLTADGSAGFGGMGRGRLVISSAFRGRRRSVCRGSPRSCRR